MIVFASASAFIVALGLFCALLMALAQRGLLRAPAPGALPARLDPQAAEGGGRRPEGEPPLDLPARLSRLRGPPGRRGGERPRPRPGPARGRRIPPRPIDHPLFGCGDRIQPEG